MSYLRDHGARKVEANALMARPDHARQLCLDTILSYLPATAPQDYLARLQESREELQSRIAEMLSGA